MHSHLVGWLGHVTVTRRARAGRYGPPSKYGCPAGSLGGEQLSPTLLDTTMTDYKVRWTTLPLSIDR